MLAVCKKRVLNELGTNNVILTSDGTFVLDGNEYYTFIQIVNDIPYLDSKMLVKKSDYNMYNYYSNGDLFPIYEDGTYGNKITSPSNPIEISIGELCKNTNNYIGQYVKVTGIINYINESLPTNDMIIANDRGEHIYINYLDNTPYLKGDLVTVTGLAMSTTSDFSANGIPVTIPRVDFGKID